MNHIKWKALFITQAILIIVGFPLLRRVYNKEFSELEWLSFTILLWYAGWHLVRQINDILSNEH
jgi:hypothetical protein